MLNLRGMERICIIGGGTAGWFSALHLREIFSPSVEIILISSPEIPIVGVGEGGILNLMETLHKLKIPFAEFMQETDAIHKLGFVYEGWRDNKSNLTDCFYHMFPMQNEELLWKDSGYYPILSMMLNHNLPISYITESINLSEKNISQEYLTKLLLEKTKKNFASSFHFDTYKVGQYLKRIALQRGVKYKEGLFNDVIRDSQTGLITDLYIDNQVLPVNFVIDASGFSRQIMGKVLKSPWTSFEKYLPANTAIPFHLKHLKKNPDLVTRSTAMDAGWVWQIPLKDRVGAGYVFDRNFISPDEAVKEVEQWLGHEIDPIRTITFEAGCYEKIWIGNVLSVGLASGFVEPLEATSIGQMLYQLSLFAELVIESHGVVSKQIIDIFNEQNLQGWHGIRDFIRMHYDTPRKDTNFWRNMPNVPISNEYNELKHVWQHRTPREIDFINYEMGGKQQFGVYSWLAIGQALSIIKPEASAAELFYLSVENKHRLAKYFFDIKNKIKVN